MILKNAVVIDGDFKQNRLDIDIQDGRIAQIGKHLEGESLDLSGMYVVPGFIDTHMHGAYGVELAEPEVTAGQIQTVCAFEASQGVTCFAPAIRILAPSDMCRAIERIRSAKPARGAKIGGIHVEGPFVSETYRGALLKDYIQKPSVDMVKSFCKAGGGLVRILTLSPELEGAEDVIRYAVSNGITVSIGHTNASYEETENAIAWGAARLTHTFNAMRPLHHRSPGVLGSALTNEKVICELICDFIHLHPAAVKMVYLLKGDDRINVISDSCAAAGKADGEYMLGGQKRYVKDGVIRTEDGTIAGSSKTVYDGVKNLVRIGVPLESAVKMASINPAKALKIDKETGSIAEGKAADLVVLDKDLHIRYTFVDGTRVFDSEAS